MEILIATQNQGKVKEYQRLLADIDVSIIGLRDIGLGKMDVEETGTTFEANALLKAEAYAKASGKIALADDSGLEVDALDGRPGVYSARYGKPEFDDAGRRQYLLKEMNNVAENDRSARFRCVIAIYNPDTDESYTTDGTCEGIIRTEERDAGQGFGYDAVFQPDGFDKSFAELDSDEKNLISHRGQAVKGLPEILAKL
ncbi:MAG: RdgB/HAM1 family non-canonical purine NTP pyrophosphatase [Chloroflexota bacterium]